KYSAWQKDGSFHYVHKTPFGKYSFICVDASLTPGPKKPYNFYGILNANKMEELSALISESRESNHTILFGHYPTSSIISVSPGIRTAMRFALVYLCGHFHTLGGLMPVLHTRHPDGTLELEYRILAFDHDLFSFADLKFEEWPVILITNPKSYLYSSYAHEPLQRILHSTHIRILAFSPSPIKFVKIMIDDIYLGDAIQVSGPLYVLKWSPKNYSQGFHQIAVTVKVRTFFVLSIIFQLTLLIIFRFRAKPKFKKPPGVAVRTSFSLHVLSKIDLFFYSFLVLNLYTVLGPWFIAELIDDHVGVCFSFGLIVNGQFFEGSVTFIFGILQVLFFNLPLMAYTCWCLLLRCQGQCFRSHLYLTKPYWTVPIHLTMLLLFFWQVFSCYILLKTYGTLAFFLSPIKTGVVALTLFLVYRIWTMESILLRTFTLDIK
ncbi:Transmembrane protein 62, partial [Ophiophagus hannah]